MMIQALLLVTLVLLTPDLLAWKSQRFQDRSILDQFGWHLRIGADLANWSTRSLFLIRLALLSAPLGRSVWRLAMYEDDDDEMHKRVAAALQMRLHLQQTVSALPPHNSEDNDTAQSRGPTQSALN
jgi:hypothetical protein